MKKIKNIFYRSLAESSQSIREKNNPDVISIDLDGNDIYLVLDDQVFKFAKSAAF